MKKIKITLNIILMMAAILLSACDNNSTAKTISVGNPAPDFTLTSSDGSQVSLSEYMGQPVLLFFHMAEG